MSKTEDRIAIMQAAVAGETIEYLDIKRNVEFGIGWREYPAGSCPEWQWMDFEYRIKEQRTPQVGDVLKTKNIPSDWFEGDEVQVIHVRDGKDKAYLCIDNTPGALKRHAGATTNAGNGIWFVRKGQFEFSDTPAAVPTVYEYINVYSEKPASGIYRDMWGVPHATREAAIRAATVALTGEFPKEYLGTLKAEVK